VSERVEHVARPRIPWRDNGVRTECGLPAAAHPVISRAAFTAKLRQLGKQRTAMTTCMTCFNTALRWPTWEENPAACLGRETQAYRTDKARELNDELRAIALLVSRHREEFDGLMGALADVTRLDSKRFREATRGS
jgi:hypothetical protein